MPSAAVRRLSPLQWAGIGLGGCAVLLALLGLLAPASAFFFPLLSLWASVGLFVLALCALRVAGAELDFFHKAVVFGIWAVAVVYFYWTLSSRSFVYVWDYANYLLKQYRSFSFFREDYAETDIVLFLIFRIGLIKSAVLSATISHTGTETAHELEYSILNMSFVSNTSFSPSGTSFFAFSWK